MKIPSLLPYQNERYESQTMVMVLWWFLVFVVGYLFVQHSILSIWDYIGRDFEIFHQAAGSLWNGRSPYEEILSDRANSVSGRIVPWGHYIYPTNFACLMLPLIGFPVFWAKKVFVGISILVFGAIFHRVFRMVMPPKAGPWGALVLFASGLLWGPVMDTFRLGQSNVPVFVFMFLAWLYAGKGREVPSGIFLGLACSIKLTPIAFLPLCLAAGRTKTAFVALGSALFTWLVLFPSYNAFYFTRIVPAMSSLATDETVPTLHGALLHGFKRWGLGRENLSLVVPAVCYLVFGGKVFLERRRIKADGVLLLGMFIVPALTAERSHHYMISFFPLLYVLGRLMERGWNPWAVLKTISLLLLLVGGYYHLTVQKAIAGSIGSGVRLMDGHLLSLGTIAAAFIFWRVVLPPSQDETLES